MLEERRLLFKKPQRSHEAGMPAMEREVVFAREECRQSVEHRAPARES